jgi:thymidylate kinase
MSGLAELDRLAPNAIGAIDEGYLHRCAYIAATGKGYNACVDILDKLPQPDMLVLVHVPLEEARRRFVHRMPTLARREVAANRFGRRYTDHRLVRDFFEYALRLYRKRGVITHQLDNIGDVDTAIADLVQDIMQFHSKLRLPPKRTFCTLLV